MSYLGACSFALQASDNEAPVQRLPAVETNLDRVPHQMTLADRPGAGVRNDRKGNVAARVERERGERAQFSPGERLVALTPKLRLDGPVFAVPGAGDEVNALVGVWKNNPFTDLGGHLTQ